MEGLSWNLARYYIENTPSAPWATMAHNSSRRCEALRAIPYGQTQTYGKIAAVTGRPNAARAMGMANHDNPLLIFIPCRRVVGKNGAFTGFACGLEAKRWVLELEGARLVK